MTGRSWTVSQALAQAISASAAMGRFIVVDSGTRSGAAASAHRETGRRS